MTERNVTSDSTYLTDGGAIQIGSDPPFPWGVRLRAGVYSSKSQSGANGRDTENPYSMSYLFRDEPEGSWVNTDDPAARYFNSVLGYNPYTNSDEYDLLGPHSCLSLSDHVRLNAKAADKVRETDFNAAVAGGEARETYRMISGALGRVARAAKNARIDAVRRVVKQVLSSKQTRQDALRLTAREFPVHLRDAWMSVRYGWGPALADIKSALDYFTERKALGSTSRFRTRVRRVEPRIRGGWPSICQSRKQMIVLVTEAPSELSRLGLDDPFSLAWELLPLSFVIDWVLPVGDYLAAQHLSTKFTATYVVSEKHENYLECQTHSIGPFVLTLNRPLKIHRVSFTRTVSSSMPTVTLPGLKDPRESGAAGLHLADSIALLSQSLLPRLTTAERRLLTRSLISRSRA